MPGNDVMLRRPSIDEIRDFVAKWHEADKERFRHPFIPEPRREQFIVAAMEWLIELYDNKD